MIAIFALGLAYLLKRIARGRDMPRVRRRARRLANWAADR